MQSMHQIQFRLGSAPDPAGQLIVLLDLLAGFKGQEGKAEGRERAG